MTQTTFLIKEIEKKRQLMIELGNKMGLNAQETIRTSQELDKLLNQLQHVQPNYFMGVSDDTLVI